MLHQIAETLTDKLYEACKLDKSKRPIYVYGLELTFSSASSILSILIISACLSIFSSAVVFLVFFCSLRLFSGGYHAKTYGRCFVLTNGVYCATVGCVLFSEKMLQHPALSLIGAALLLLSVITILVLAPVKNQHHPLSPKRYLRNRRIACILSVVFLFVAAIVFGFGKEHYFILISFTLMAVAVMMIIPTIQERRAQLWRIFGLRLRL